MDLIDLGSMLVVDAVRGYVVEKMLEPALRPAWAVIKSLLLPRWDPAIDAIRLNLQEAVDKRRAEDREFDRRVGASLQRGEEAALVTRLARAAAQATTDERMEMLAAAAAGILTPDLDSEMRSRVSRAVEELEPSDVIALRDVARTISAGKSVEQVPGVPENRIALLQAGCLLEAQGVGYRSKYEPTPVLCRNASEGTMRESSRGWNRQVKALQARVTGVDGRA